MYKSTVDEIRERFDSDVERFANLDTGQLSTIDAKISLEIITETAARIIPNANNLLDIGCGAGNYTLAMLAKKPELNCTLVDLSKPMLERAFERISKQTNEVHILQGDIRTVKLQDNFYDIILAGAVLHHLRDDNDWQSVFTKLYRVLKPNGCLLISDLVTHENKAVNAYMTHKYADYLDELFGQERRQQIFEYIDKEDSPRSITYQLNLMKKTGFRTVDILHKNICFGAFCGIK